MMSNRVSVLRAADSECGPLLPLARACTLFGPLRIASSRSYGNNRHCAGLAYKCYELAQLSIPTSICMLLFALIPITITISTQLITLPAADKPLLSSAPAHNGTAAVCGPDGKRTYKDWKDDEEDGG